MTLILVEGLETVTGRLNSQPLWLYQFTIAILNQLQINPASLIVIKLVLI